MPFYDYDQVPQKIKTELRHGQIIYRGYDVGQTDTTSLILQYHLMRPRSIIKLHIRFPVHELFLCCDESSFTSNDPDGWVNLGLHLYRFSDCGLAKILDNDMFLALGHEILISESNES